MILFDTNLVSELARRSPDSRVQAWVLRVAGAERYTTAITVAELMLGIAVMPAGSRRDTLAGVVTALVKEAFAGRVLPFDEPAAEAYAALAAARRRAGRPIGFQDGAIAAIGLAHGATVATRNTRDFEGCGVALIDPWA